MVPEVLLAPQLGAAISVQCHPHAGNLRSSNRRHNRCSGGRSDGHRDAGEVRDRGSFDEPRRQVVRYKVRRRSSGAVVVDAVHTSAGGLLQHEARGARTTPHHNVDTLASKAVQNELARLVVADPADPGGRVAEAGGGDGDGGLGTGHGQRHRASVTR